MRLIFGFAAIGLMAGSYVVCPEAVRTSINDTLTPNTEALVEMRQGLDAIMRHLDGPGEMSPDLPVRTSDV
jgi:hypothetical protein